MTIRTSSVAGMFYPGSEHTCRSEIEACLGTYQPPEEPAHPVAGIVPHAGWTYSGPTAAKVLKSIKDKTTPETFLIFGAVHVWGVGNTASLFSEGAWQTPCGTIDINEELASALLQAYPDMIKANASAHNQEHSIEVQIPFIQYLFPQAKIVPMMIAPSPLAAKLGQQIGSLLATYDKPICVLGSTDLTHYGPRFGFTPYGIGIESVEPMKANDLKMIQLATEMKAIEVIQEVETHHNACGAGAIAATVAAARELGATRGYLLEHITSQDVMPDRQVSDFVGYAGMIF